MAPNIGNNESISALYLMLVSRPVPNPLAVMLTFKQGAYFETSKGSSKQNLTTSDEVKCVRQFMHRINQKVFGKAFLRFNRRLSVIPVFEGYGTVNRHLNLSLEKPATKTRDEFEQLIRECWGKTEFGNNYVNIQDQYDDGWIEYLLKQKSKIGIDGILSSVDWDNYYSNMTSSE